MRQAEYDADAAAARIGRGPELISALEKLSAFEAARTGWEAALYRTHPPTALRIERLEPRIPGDEHYQEPELGIDRKAAAEWAKAMAAALVIVIALVIGGGYAINIYNSHRQMTGSGAVARADATVADYTTTFITGLTDPSQYNGAITQFADPSAISTLQANANATDQDGTPFGPIDSSEATAIGCRYYSNPPTVAIRVDWTFGRIGYPDREVWFTDDIPLSFVNDSWKVKVLPSLPTENTAGLSNSERPAGFTNCE
jgi:hypothetical protein